MILIVLENRELKMLGTVPLVEFTLVSKSFLVVLNRTLQTSISRVRSADELHSLHEEVMLIHIGHKLECKLYLFEGVTNYSVVSSTTFVGTCVGSSRSFFYEFSHSLLNIGICLLFWCTHHTSFNVRYHEEN